METLPCAGSEHIAGPWAIRIVHLSVVEQRERRDLAIALAHDLQADGDVESNPGPRYITKNLNSIHGGNKLYTTLKAIRNESNREQITAVMLQDHSVQQQKLG